MHLAKPSLKRWLKQQQQIIDKCTNATLVQALDDGRSQIIAIAPETTEPDQPISLAIKEVLHKQRLHLAPAGEQKMLMAQPIFYQGKLWGAVVLSLQTNDKKDIPASLKMLQQGLTWLQFLLAQHDIPAPVTTKTAAKENPQAAALLLMMNNLLKENSLQETAISLVNFLAAQLQSPRVSLGLQDKSGINLVAVSFSANFDKRTATMQAISDAMDEAADQRTDIHVATETQSDSSIIQRYHEQLLTSQKIAAIDSFLLRKNSQIIGVITVEYRHPIFPGEQQTFLQAALVIIGDLIVLKQSNETKIRQQIKSHALKKLERWLGGNKSNKKIIGGAIVLAIFLLFFPADYWVNSDASLQSTTKYMVVSPQDGYLSSIKVRPGASVKKGDVLAQLNDEDLRLERRKIFSQMQQSQQEYDNALANANRAQAAIANEKVEQANSQLQLIEQQQLRTQLISPSDGTITSDDISQSLGAPVKQGQNLFEISASQGYLVQLWVDERDINSLSIGQKGKIKLTSVPNEIFPVTVKSITPISEIREGKNYFRVEATLDNDAELLRPGMTGSGKILASRESLGWIWFHDVWYWLRLKLWL